MKDFKILITGQVDDDVPDDLIWAAAACAEVQVDEPEIPDGDGANDNRIRFTTHNVTTSVSVTEHIEES